MNRRLAVAIPFVFALVLPSSAEVGLRPIDLRLVGVSGRVLVNAGEAFELAREGQTLRTGDRWLLLPGASASVVGGEGCRRDYRGPGLWTRVDDFPCGAVPAGTGTDAATGRGVAFDGPAFLRRTGGLGEVPAEHEFNSYGP